jgi:hypothetical protein
VGWDGAVTAPAANEVGWKDTILMNPLEDAIIALRQSKPTLPWDLPNSIRPLDVTTPIGSSLPLQFHNIDPINEPAPVINHPVNYGWEYVWHCHLLGHEENDMMRAMSFAVAPKAPTTLTATKSGPAVLLRWSDNSLGETNWTIQRADAPSGPWITVTMAPTTTGPQKGGIISYTDASVVPAKNYYYRVLASNVVGDTTAYAAPVAGYPVMQVDSTPTTTVKVTT